MVWWTRNCLDDHIQRVLVKAQYLDRDCDKWCPSVLRQVLFNTFISDTDNGIECTLHKFAGNPKMNGAIDIPEVQDVFQRDLGYLEKWAQKNLLGFNKGIRE